MSLQERYRQNNQAVLVAMGMNGLTHLGLLGVNQPVNVIQIHDAFLTLQMLSEATFIQSTIFFIRTQIFLKTI